MGNCTSGRKRGKKSPGDMRPNSKKTMVSIDEDVQLDKRFNSRLSCTRNSIIMARKNIDSNWE